MRRWRPCVALLCLAGAAGLDAATHSAFVAADKDLSGLLNEDEFESALLAHARGPTVVREGLMSVPLPALRMPRAAAFNAAAPESGFYKAFFNSLGMIWATEIGDKTFFIAAVLAMRHPRYLIFAGAIAALAVMTVLSVLVGYALPSLLPRKYTHYASAALFLYFGLRLLRDATKMEAGKTSEELEEVEEELGHATHKKDIEGNGGEDDQGKAKGPNTWRIFSQAFMLTFLAEWGDRSQIATIALAAAKDPVGVTLGGVTGHAMCTGLAVVGGRMLASRISERTVAYFGGAIFLVFALYSFFVEDIA